MTAVASPHAAETRGLVPIVRTPKGTFVSAAGLRSVDDGKTWQEMDKFPDYGVNLGDRSKNWSVPGSGYRNELVCLSNGLLLASEIVGRGKRRRETSLCHLRGRRRHLG